MIDSLRLPVIVLLSLAVLGMGLLSPLVDDDNLPDIQEFGVHVALVKRAFHALESGQWPPRVDVWKSDHEGLGYPVFQFYAPLAHTGSAVIMKVFHLNKPYTALRILMLGALILGGAFMFLSAREITGGEGPALVAAILYISTPYLLLNLFVRGTIPEFIGECMIPAVIYATLRCRESLTLDRVIGATAAWLALLLSHTITSFFFIPFLAAFLVIDSLLARRPLSRLPPLALPLLLAVAAGAWFLWPVLTYPVAIKAQFGPMPESAYTPLWTLLAPAPIPPFPLPSPRLGLEGLRPALGLPALAGMLLTVLGLLHRDTWRRHREVAAAGAAMLVVFALAVLVVWMPLPALWSRVPFIGVMQFSYRMLSQVAWSGGLLAAIGAFLLFRQTLDLRFALLGGFVCVMAVSGYVAPPRDGTPIRQVEESPYANTDYRVRDDRTGPWAPEPSPFHKGSCRVGEGVWRCPVDRTLAGRAVLLPIQYYPGLMTVTAGKERLAPLGVRYDGRLLLGLAVPAAGLPGGADEVTVRFTGSRAANLVSGVTLALLGAASLAAAAAALRGGRRRRAAVAALIALPLLGLPASTLSPGFAHLLRGRSQPELRTVPSHDWVFSAAFALTPPAAVTEREPLMTAAHAMDQLLVFLEPVPGDPGRVRVGLERQGRPPVRSFGPPVALAPGHPVRLDMMVRAANDEPATIHVTLNADGVPILDADTPVLPVDAFRQVEIGTRPVWARAGAITERFSGTLTATRLGVEELDPPLFHSAGPDKP